MKQFKILFISLVFSSNLSLACCCHKVDVVHDKNPKASFILRQEARKEKPNIDVIKEAVISGAYIEAMIGRGIMKRTILQYFSSVGNKEAVIILLEANVNLNAQDNFGQTALHWAARKGQLEVLKVLLEAGSDRKVIGILGKTAADLAKENNKTQCVEYLQELS